MSLSEKIYKIVSFYKTEIWKNTSQELSWLRRTGYKFFRVLFISLKEFNNDRCNAHASALTYFTLLSIVPILAIAFGIAQKMGLDHYLIEEMKHGLEGQEFLLSKLLLFSENLMERTKGGVVALFGAAMLLWTVFSLLGHVEKIFNEIWSVEKARSLLRRTTAYLIILILGPTSIILAATTTVFLYSNIEANIQNEYLLHLFSFVGDITPYVIIWFLFTAMYYIIPNSRTGLRSTLISGIVAGTIFQVVEYYYFNVQMSISAYNVIYGSFAALPLLLIWTRLSWMIILWGAELSFAISHEDEYLALNGIRDI